MLTMATTTGGFLVLGFLIDVYKRQGLAYYLSGGSFLVMLLTYALLTAGVICFLIRFLRPLFLLSLIHI